MAGIEALRRLRRIGTLAWSHVWLAMAGASLAIPGSALNAVENTPGVTPAVEKYPEGARIYREQCASCHDNNVPHAPAKVILGYMTADAILSALTDGPMQAQGAVLNRDEKVAVAQHVSGQALGAAQVAQPAPPACTGKHATFDRAQVPAFVGSGLDRQSTHSVSRQEAGIDVADLSRLKLKWSFGFPLANRARSQPALGGGAIFVGSHGGTVYALDRETGCARWTFAAGSEVRTAIVLSPWKANDEQAVPLVFFGDWTGNAYAVEAFTGKLAWKLRADDHPAAVLTAAPALYGDTLYVPVSSLETAAAAAPNYPCCTFRGSVLALDPRTGREKWRRWLVDEPKLHANGRTLGPSGVPSWAGIAIDEKRGNLIIGTGNNYSAPATALSDSIVALGLKTGAIRWHFQATPGGDAWNIACVIGTTDNCPPDPGPDYDISAIPILATADDGRDYVLAGQKSGVVWALDARTGKLAWKRQVGRGGTGGGVHFGLAAQGGRLFVGISDMDDGTPRPGPARPGVYALDIATGKALWSAPAPDGVCAGRPLCIPGNSGAITATPDYVLAGGDDGFVRAYDSATGKVLWQFDTVQDFAAVNAVPTRGGAISGGAAPVVDNGQLIVSSGYGFVSKIPGNALLVFEAE